MGEGWSRAFKFHCIAGVTHLEHDFKVQVYSLCLLIGLFNSFIVNVIGIAEFVPAFFLLVFCISHIYFPFQLLFSSK